MRNVRYFTFYISHFAFNTLHFYLFKRFEKTCLLWYLDFLGKLFQIPIY